MPTAAATRSQKRRRSAARSSAHWATLRTWASSEVVGSHSENRVLGKAERRAQTATTPTAPAATCPRHSARTGTPIS